MSSVAETFSFLFLHASLRPGTCGARSVAANFTGCTRCRPSPSLGTRFRGRFAFSRVSPKVRRIPNPKCFLSWCPTHGVPTSRGLARATVLARNEQRSWRGGGSAAAAASASAASAAAAPAAQRRRRRLRSLAARRPWPLGGRAAGRPQVVRAGPAVASGGGLTRVVTKKGFTMVVSLKIVSNTFQFNRGLSVCPLSVQ